MDDKGLVAKFQGEAANQSYQVESIIRPSGGLFALRGAVARLKGEAANQSYQVESILRLSGGQFALRGAVARLAGFEPANYGLEDRHIPHILLF